MSHIRSHRRGRKCELGHSNHEMWSILWCADDVLRCAVIVVRRPVRQLKNKRSSCKMSPHTTNVLDSYGANMNTGIGSSSSWIFNGSSCPRAHIFLRIWFGSEISLGLRVRHLQTVFKTNFALPPNIQILTHKLTVAAVHCLCVWLDPGKKFREWDWKRKGKAGVCVYEGVRVCESLHSHKMWYCGKVQFFPLPFFFLKWGPCVCGGLFFFAEALFGTAGVQRNADLCPKRSSEQLRPPATVGPVRLIRGRFPLLPHGHMACAGYITALDWV